MGIFKRKSKQTEDGARLSSSDPPKPLFTRGIKVLYSCEDAIVDICFVHGLTGDRETTWTANGQTLPWPQTLLPPRLPKARILTFGYDAYVARAGPASTNGIADHATNLVNDLVGNRESCNATSHRLIFVAHSLGGLVCKSALEYSRSNPGRHLRNVLDTIIGIVFFGTPHRGSWMANWGRIPVSALGVWQSGNTKLMDVLRTKSELLETIRESFSRLIWGLKEDGREIKVTCFYEEMPLPVVGLIVPKESATLESSLNFSIHQDHRNMVKFVSADDSDFLKLLYELRRWTNSIDHAQPATETPLSLGDQSHTTKSRHGPPRLVPLGRNNNFTGRAQDLERLRQMAAPKEQATTKVAIAGLGGIGKTQLALEYVYQQGRKHPDCAVFWISCVSRETIDQGYQAVVHALGDDGKVDMTNKTDKADDLAIQKLLCDRLSRQDSGRWILVFDNVDDISFWENSRHTTHGLRGLIDCLPRSELGTIVFTTRDLQIAIRLARQNVVKLSEMDSADNRQLLQNLLVDKSLVQSENNEETEELLSRLMYLPLALAQAAYYINMNQITITDYLSLLNAQEEQTIELLSRDFEDGQQVRHPVATTWLISFKKIKTKNPLAADYISFMACTDSKDIPESLLPSAPSPLAKAEAIGTLKAYSFISKHSHQAELLSMHRLVHLAARNWLRIEKTLHIWTDQAVRKLSKVLKASYGPLWKQRRSSMPHAYYVLSQRTYTCQRGSPLIDLIESYADRLLYDGRYRDAERYFREYLDICKKQQEASHPGTFASMTALVWLYVQLGRFDEATKLGEEALDKSRAILGDDHRYTLASMSSLAMVYRRLGQIDEATTLGEETLQKSRDILGDDHPTTLVTMTNQASIFHQLGRHDEASKLGEESLQKLREILGADHPTTLVTMINLAVIFQNLGRLDEASKLGEESLQKHREILGADHPETLTAMINLASTFYQLGRLDEAAKLGEETLQKHREILGDDHPQTISAMFNLSAITKGRGQHAYALELMKTCVEASLRCLGPDHKDTIMHKSCLEDWEA